MRINIFLSDTKIDNDEGDEVPVYYCGDTRIGKAIVRRGAKGTRLLILLDNTKDIPQHVLDGMRCSDKMWSINKYNRTITYLMAMSS